MIMPGKKGGDNEQKYLLAGHFNGHGGATVQYRIHRLMNKVQGFHKSH
jgi:hypothetical protein